MAATSDTNFVVLVGRIVRDAEARYANNGTAIVSFSLAVNRSRKNGDQWVSEANFFDVSYFGKAAEAVKQYLTKGKQVAVQGSLTQDRWEKDGQKFSKIQILANSVQLLGSRGGDGSSSDSYSSPSAGNSFAPRDNFSSFDAGPAQSFGGDGQGFQEDIPF